MIRPIAYEVELQLFPDRGTLIYTNEEFLNMPNRAKLLEKGAAVPLYAIPEGYALVPIEPTQEMVNAYLDAMDSNLHRFERIAKSGAAMIKAGGVK